MSATPLWAARGEHGGSMSRALNFQWYALVILAVSAVAATCVADSQPGPQAPPAAPPTAATPAPSGTGPSDAADPGGQPPAPVIAKLCNTRGTEIDGNRPSGVGLNDVLWVVLGTEPASAGGAATDVSWCRPNAPVKLATAPGVNNQPATRSPGAAATAQSGELDASQYVLFLNGRQLSGVAAVYDGSRHALGFRLTRSDSNAALWREILGSPTASTRAVTVALGVVEPGGAVTPTIVGTGTKGKFELRVYSVPWLIAAAVAVVAVVLLVFGTAKTTTTLRDNLLPQLPPNQQPYSLGRCQMAFWFVLIFVAFLFLYILLWDYNTVSPQALALMGISAATALASVAVDVVKDSPADAVNRGLQALELNSYADVERLRHDLASSQAAVPAAQAALQTKQSAAAQAVAAAAAAAGDPTATVQAKSAAQSAADAAVAAVRDATQLVNQLQSDVRDRSNMLRTWRDKTQPFLSEGIWKDLTTDINGPTVHRMQVIFWTLALGVVFVVGVYRDLAMPPDFSATLMALMGISGASYVGFKYPEQNN